MSETPSEHSNLASQSPQQTGGQSSRETSFSTEAILEQGRQVVHMEAYALSQLISQIDDAFADAVRLILESSGKVILTGVGKSGIIARKIAATMNSTGTPAAYLHPSDGMHGDLGLLSEEDIVIAIGKSGESDELLRLLPALRQLGAKVIAITGNRESSLAEYADLILFTPIEREACPLDLAPTVSTTVAMAVGDALAMTLMKCKNFKSEDFARYHPGGQLGRRLLLKVSDLMIPIQKCPVLSLSDSTVEDLIGSLGKFGYGIVLFSEDGQTLDGVLTDGDVRRLLSQYKEQVFSIDLKTVVNTSPVTLSSQVQAVEALKKMEDHQPPLNVLPIVDDGQLQGIARLHELLSVR